jgi:hypothetical protein
MKQENLQLFGEVPAEDLGKTATFFFPKESKPSVDESAG